MPTPFTKALKDKANQIPITKILADHQIYPVKFVSKGSLYYCPIHEHANQAPKFKVYSDSNRAQCFLSGKTIEFNYDALAIYMQLEKVDITEAVQALLAHD